MVDGEPPVRWSARRRRSTRSRRIPVALTLVEVAAWSHERTHPPVAGPGAADVSEPARVALFGPVGSATTVGLVLLTLVTAFEAMGVGTADAAP